MKKLVTLLAALVVAVFLVWLALRWIFSAVLFVTIAVVVVWFMLHKGKKPRDRFIRRNFKAMVEREKRRD